MFGMKGIADRAAKLDDAFSVPLARPHFLQNRTAKTPVLSVYVVDQSKPLASPATIELWSYELRATYPQTATGARSAAIVRAVIFADIITAGVPPPGCVFAPTR